MAAPSSDLSARARRALAAVSLSALGLLAACGDSSSPSVPLDASSPWPKFRANAVQDGRGRIHARRNDALSPWVFQTGKGIFSSPVVGADETVYLGSADRTFYALRPDGTERWHFQTGEIIDSAGLLDDRGHVYFGSGDGHVYALDAASGSMLWAFQADDPATTGAYIRWFEGNVAILPDGTLVAPNDDFRIFGIDRDTGTKLWGFETKDQTWSSPAVDAATGTLYIGNNNAVSLLGDNIFAIHPDGSLSFSAVAEGTIAASPVLMKDHGSFVLGGFDGYVRAYATGGDSPGGVAWEFPTRDHVYASAARLPDGALVVPSADGTIYALEASTGAVRWAFDTHDPIRSSPAVDADGHVYVGGGDGKLYVLEPDGTLRWRMQLVTGERNDVNSSPALGRNGVYVGAESGEIFFVPYDYCLGTAGMADARCEGSSVGEGLPANGASIVYTSQVGGLVDVPPTTIDPNQAMAFTLIVRESGDTALALIDDTQLAVDVTPNVPHTVRVSADRHFLIVVPESPFVAGGDSKVHLRIHGPYLENPTRSGLRFSGGTPAGTFDTTFDFALSAPRTSSLPYAIPTNVGTDPSGVFELYRLAAPLPTILPSYNQIGFDSIHWLAGMVEGNGNRAIAWIVGATLDASNHTVIDPTSKAMFPVVATYQDGFLTLENKDSFALEAFTFPISFERFRLSTRVDALGDAQVTPSIYVTTKCNLIPFYGQFLRQLGYCNPTTDDFSVFGAALLRHHDTGLAQVPAGVGSVAFAASANAVTATITGGTLTKADHLFAVLLVDATTGEPVSLAYGTKTTVTTDGGGHATSVAVDTTGATLPVAMRAYLMVDTVPVARGMVP